jgi:hypothetical protein
MKKLVLFSSLSVICAAIMISRGALDLVGADESLPRAEISDELPQIAAAPKSGRGLASIAAPVATDDLHAPLSEAEKESVRTYLQILANQEEIGASTEKLLGELNKSGLKPAVARNSNPQTGAMAMVRTDNALPGTRYFHAQLFEADGAAHMQHVSFEIRPGADAMEAAVSLIKQTHRDLGNPIKESPGYTMWRNRDGRLVSARRMTEEDLKDNYFNAHGKEDVGTVWVVSEDDPEEPGE